uniref:Putative glucosidase ii beta subunit n=1 Tax=Amblyomma aureolatum TaxID=187763 RepID=A0A1E1WYM2_9ACAR
MAWTPRVLLKRRNVIAALFLFGILYMMRQLLSLREVDVGRVSLQHRTAPAASVVAAGNKTVVSSLAPQLHVAPPKVESSVRGVAPHNANHYAPGKTFKCLYSAGVIGFEQVNDDYCDCDDGSDEPGTNACPNGRFYCEQHNTHSPETVLSMRVNDGICDCCDGSDEWNGAMVPPELQLSEEQQGRTGVFQAPCKLRC